MIDDADLKKIYEDDDHECYRQRLKTLQNRDFDTTDIEKGIDEVRAVIEGGERSFVVYGEPQSGKTEFMIALVCQLIDMGKQTIFIVKNDNTELEDQNFERFQQAAELNPAPIRDRELTYMEDSDLREGKQRIIFCRKNSPNLQKLIERCRFMNDRVVIDDEADYATPNAKINKDQVTEINKYLGQLGHLIPGFADQGTYIGVTATPGRLDLNNTYRTNSNFWVFLKSHKNYKGRTFFFPSTQEQREASDYVLVKLPDDRDDPKFIRHAVFRYLIRVSLLNRISLYDLTAYSMLIHTGGQINDHLKDQQDIQKILSTIENRDHPKHTQYLREIFAIAEELSDYYQHTFDPVEIARFIFNNIGRRQILVINSKDKKKDNDNVKRAGKPSVLFTFAIGGNIVSRGLTFERLLTFYFSRTVKGKLQQNTYIQRARMFGNRDYSEYFELCVPESLFADWADCFQHHELSLILAKQGSYQHIESKRTSAADSAAIDKRHVNAIRGERTIGEIFKLTPEIESRLLSEGRAAPVSVLRDLLRTEVLNENHFPEGILDYIENTTEGDESQVLMVLRGDQQSGYVLQDIERFVKTGGDTETITRTDGGGIIDGMIKGRGLDSFKHYILPVRNIRNEARFYYRPNLGHTILRNKKVSRPINQTK